MAALSEEDFQRLQTQLLESRTKNYSLEEKSSKYQNELIHVSQYLEELKKDLAKAQRTIQRSKTARDVDQLVQENERLQRKLQSQEDEFRLQNETLMHEVSSLVSCNDKLEKDLELSKSQSCLSTDNELHAEMTRLQAETAALRKLLSKSETLCDSAKSEFNGTSNAVNGTEVNSFSTGEFQIQSDMDPVLKLRLEIEFEEKRILKEQIQKQEVQYREGILLLQNENDKLSEKLKKKQESLLQLQEEKEHMYIENKKSCENLQAARTTEVQQLKGQIHSMQVQLKSAVKYQEKHAVSDLGGSPDCEPEATVEFIAGEKASFECSLNETKMSLLRSQEKLRSLSCQLEESETSINKLKEEKLMFEQEKQSLQQEKNDLELVMVEKSNLAEKRKNLMDEMNNHLLETTNKHSKEIENLTQQLSEEQDALQKLFDKEKEARLELLQSRNEVQNLKDENEKMKKNRSIIDYELKEACKQLGEAKEGFEKQLQQKDDVHTAAVNILENELKAQLNDLTIQVEVARAEKTEFEEKVAILQQEAKDTVDEKKIQEKKGLSMVKDLKRQLLVERKRAEKLQERLQELLNEPNRSVEDILQPCNPSDKPKGDTSSVSSWSYVSGGTADRDNPEGTLHSDGSSGGRESPSQVSPNTLETETSNLLSKVAHLQQRNWMLEEKVNHLEMSNEALVDDLLKKTAIIQYYCMEGRSDPHSSVVQDKLTIKRIVDFIKDRGDENLREINRRMQRMLEETLTKNMHLQKDIETLSNEVSRLSKMIQVSVDDGHQSAVFVDGI